MANATTPAAPTAPTLTIPTLPNAAPKKSYADIYADAAKTISGNVDPSINAVSSFIPTVQQDAQNVAKTYTGEIPTVTNIYSDLAKNLQIQYGSQVDKLNAQKTSDVAGAKVAAAKSGFDSTQGYQAALVSNIKASADKQIQGVLDQYGVQSDQLMQEASKSVSDLIAESQQAIQQGDTTAADLASKVAGLKMQEQQMITDASNNILSAQTQDEKAYWQQTYQSAILDIRQQTLDLSAQRLQYTESKGGRGGGTAKLNVGTLTSYGQNLGLSNQDIQNAIDYGTANGYTQAQIQEMMLSGSNKSAAASSAAAPAKTTSGGIFNAIGNDIGAVTNWLGKIF